MEKKGFSFWHIVIIVIILLVCLGAYKNLSNHHKKEYLVIDRKVLESAKECYLKGDCKDKITIKDLYDKEYLEVQIDPITKENIKSDRCIEYKNNEAIFCKE